MTTKHNLDNTLANASDTLLSDWLDVTRNAWVTDGSWRNDRAHKLMMAIMDEQDRRGTY